MKKKKLTVGLIIADEMEYVPMRAYAEKHGGGRHDLFDREGHRLVIRREDAAVQVESILCGVGMVNAAAAAAFMMNRNPDYIINTGLSGGISGIARGEITLGSRFVEHDFDLRPLGRELGEKPGQNYVYRADPVLNQHYQSQFPFMKQGCMVSGDCFVGDPALRDFLKNKWDAMSCDMESAAVAYVCALAGVGFAALRRVSDDAGDDAPESYRQMNDQAESALLDLVFQGIYAMFDNPALWDKI
ncbi:MAG: 5'-methylthioadenosine/S-adenosylhomocysteine nucleosidase [Clostridiales bacterium]|nr:5'-methylthioadenosine/S-adenosylhomocysteine nucleosidase [Clostridiales bacterium]